MQFVFSFFQIACIETRSRDRRRRLIEGTYEYLSAHSRIATTERATNYGNCKGVEAINSPCEHLNHAYRTPKLDHLSDHAKFYLSSSTANLTALENERSFDVNAWVRCMKFTIHETFLLCPEVRDRLVNELRQLLLCPRLHTVSIRIECFPLKNEEELHDILRAVAEVYAQLWGKISGRFKFETDGRENWGNERGQPFSPWVPSPVNVPREQRPPTR
ncbi:hypothetical protein HO173_007797 [Letharia columbiana]|uniref:Uncharacterized protein n=1 Tax=Letharia columbiana TaxID=112416 RepID=A0A8H6L3A6_9LECA|nr:uncharacterized protein HO173_007797 [Letharia columbiana]KAF6233967.1 hypothetical protein HO173_007797 [Letharia columbiana]